MLSQCYHNYWRKRRDEVSFDTFSSLLAQRPNTLPSSCNGATGVQQGEWSWSALLPWLLGDLFHCFLRRWFYFSAASSLRCMPSLAMRLEEEQPPRGGDRGPTKPWNHPCSSVTVTSIAGCEWPNRKRILRWSNSQGVRERRAIGCENGLARAHHCPSTDR